MYQTDKANIKSFGPFNPVRIVKLGFLKYVAVQEGNMIVAKGLKLRKYYGKELKPGRFICDGAGRYALQFENPKKLNHFDSVCVWR